MKKAARRKLPKLHHKKLSISLYYFQAILEKRPTTQSQLQNAVWVKKKKDPPDFWIIHIDAGGNIRELTVSVSRGTGKTAPDQVCWVNCDVKDHVVQFTNGGWPFLLGEDSNGDQTIPVAAGEASAWFHVDPKSGAAGLTVPYDYGVDVAPGSPGPSISSED